jgi:hypothetical protein
MFGGDTMNREERQIRKILRSLRKMNYWQRITIMDWLNGWYSDYKFQREEE